MFSCPKLISMIRISSIIRIVSHRKAPDWIGGSISFSYIRRVGDVAKAQSMVCEEKIPAPHIVKKTRSQRKGCCDSSERGKIPMSTNKKTTIGETMIKPSTLLTKNKMNALIFCWHSLMSRFFERLAKNTDPATSMVPAKALAGINILPGPIKTLARPMPKSAMPPIPMNSSRS